MSPDCQFWWNWGVSLAVALATFAAVLAALFGEQWRAIWFPPRLQLRLLGSAGEKTELRDANGNYVDDVRYYYVQVSNARRVNRAEQVQAFLTRIEEPGPSGELQTTWFGNIPIRWRDQEVVPLLRTIGAASDLDFLRVERQGGLWLMPLITPHNMPAHRTDKCRFVAHLQARSTQTDSEVLRVLVAWDGKWEDGSAEMQNHLEIRELNPERER